MSKTTLSYKNINPLLCGLYEQIYRLEAVLYASDKIDIDENKAPYVRDRLLDMGAEISANSVSKLHDLMEKLCDEIGMSPNHQELKTEEVDNG